MTIGVIFSENCGEGAKYQRHELLGGRRGRMLYVYFTKGGHPNAVRTVVLDHDEATLFAAAKRCAEVAKGVPA